MQAVSAFPFGRWSDPASTLAGCVPSKNVNAVREKRYLHVIPSRFHSRIETVNVLRGPDRDSVSVAAQVGAVLFPRESIFSRFSAEIQRNAGESTRTQDFLSIYILHRKGAPFHVAAKTPVEMAPSLQLSVPVPVKVALELEGPCR